MRNERRAYGNACTTKSAIPIRLRQEIDRRLKANYEADKARPISARLAVLVSKIEGMSPEEDDFE